jgi:hypothetical protein
MYILDTDILTTQPMAQTCQFQKSARVKLVFFRRIPRAAQPIRNNIDEFGSGTVAVERGHAIWFGGQGRSESSLDEFFSWLGPQKCGKNRLAGHAHVDGVQEVDEKECAPSGDSVRLPCPETSERSAGYGSQARILNPDYSRRTESAFIHSTAISNRVTMRL